MKHGPSRCIAILPCAGTGALVVAGSQVPRSEPDATEDGSQDFITQQGYDGGPGDSDELSDDEHEAARAAADEKAIAAEAALATAEAAAQLLQRRNSTASARSGSSVSSVAAAAALAAEEAAAAQAAAAEEAEKESRRPAAARDLSTHCEATLAVLEEGEHDLSALRVLKHAHPRGISCAAYSQRLSLIATGSSDGGVTLWEFQTLAREMRCVGHASDVVALHFLDPYPLLASADVNGHVYIWAARSAALSAMRAAATDGEWHNNLRSAAPSSGCAALDALTTVASAEGQQSPLVRLDGRSGPLHADVLARWEAAEAAAAGARLAEACAAAEAAGGADAVERVKAEARVASATKLRRPSGVDEEEVMRRQMAARERDDDAELSAGHGGGGGGLLEEHLTAFGLGRRTTTATTTTTTTAAAAAAAAQQQQQQQQQAAQKAAEGEEKDDPTTLLAEPAPPAPVLPPPGPGGGGTSRRAHGPGEGELVYLCTAHDSGRLRVWSLPQLLAALPPSPGDAIRAHVGTPLPAALTPPAAGPERYNGKLRYQHVIPRHHAGSAVLRARAHALGRQHDHKDKDKAAAETKAGSSSSSSSRNGVGASQRWRAHFEAVTCLCAVPLPAPHGADAVASSAFDFSVRVWSVERGTQVGD